MIIARETKLKINLAYVFPFLEKRTIDNLYYVMRVLARYAVFFPLKT